jgi:Ca2+-binding EF-hand superfamily protein
MQAQHIGGCGHWSKWRDNCIGALEHYDSDSDGHISTNEVFRKLTHSLDRSWVRHVSRCTLHDGIAAADGMLQYLRKIRSLQDTHAKMDEEAPQLLAFLPTGDSEASCEASLAPALEEFFAAST